MSIPDAVVFDCDGVLVDSEPHSVAAWLDVLGTIGHPADSAAIDQCVGLGFDATHAALASIAPLPAPPVVWSLVLDALGTSFEAGLRTFDDALGVLAAVEATGIPMAVGSSSPRQRLDLTLAKAGLHIRFPVSVAGDEVPNPKPAPDVFSRALELLGAPTGRCVAIEDTPIGVASAIAAGFESVIAVVRDSNQRPALESSGAQVVDQLLPAHLGL